ncbi:zinc finger domain-containing protein, partial [Paractinoplanes ferrugineus]
DRTVQLGDVPAPQYGWTEAERDEVPMFPAPRAALAVRCPKCRQPGGSMCESTGGGNRAYVTTHKARIDRIAGWTNAVQGHAEMLVKAVGHYGYANEDLFAAFETAAKPIPAKAAKQPTPKGVQLSEKQAEYIEWAAERDPVGVLYCPTTHLSGDHETRLSILALEAKGIVVQDGTEDSDRIMRLTPFGWQVYRQHRLIIRRLDDADVDRLEAATR